jgi:hypothetical protein
MMRATLPALLTLICAPLVWAGDVAESKQDRPTARLIGATTVITEVSTGLPLPARVDTGATCCSIHCDELEIKDAAPEPKDNIGKPVRFLIRHKEGDDEDKGEWVEGWEDVEKKVLVTLNDRQHMKYPVLLGRNFLRDDFLVNVSLEGDE